jgi:HD-like signal output (HDOD) protein
VSTQELVMGAALLEGVAACAGAAAEEEAEVRVEAAGLAVDVRLKPSALRPAAAPAASSADLTPVRPGPEGPPAEAPVAPPAAAAVEQPEPESPAEPEAREGWLARIGRALRGRRKEAEEPPPPEAPPEAPAPEAPAPEPGAAAKPAEAPEVEAPAAAAPAPEHPFAPFARALRVELPAEPPGVPPGEEAGDDALAARVAERAAAPGSELASFPAAALQILELVRDPKSDATRIAGFISRDPALSAGVISVANSAAFRGVSEVESVRDAVARLGLEEVGRVASAVSARAVLDPGKEGGAFRHLFTRAVAVSWAASAAAMRQRGARSDHVYLGGLLHDVGRALGARALAQLTAGGSAELTGTARAERVLDRVHARIGEAALQRWGLPQYLRDVCAHHHDEVVPPDQVDLHLVRLVSALALLREPALAARAAREILQSAGALRLGVPGVRALAADLRDAEQRAAALAR